MQYRLGHPKEEQGDAVAGGKEHGEPGGETVLGAGVVRAELDFAPARESYADDENKENGHGQHVEPAEGTGDKGQGGRENGPGPFGIADSADDQQQGDHNRWHEDGDQYRGASFGLGHVIMPPAWKK